MANGQGARAKYVKASFKILNPPPQKCLNVKEYKLDLLKLLIARDPKIVLLSNYILSNS